MYVKPSVFSRYGRKFVLLLGSALQLVMALAAAFMPTFATFSVFRFLTAVAVTHAYLTAFVISTHILEDSNYEVIM